MHSRATTEGVRPTAKENGQIRQSNTARTVGNVGSHPPSRICASSQFRKRLPSTSVQDSSGESRMDGVLRKQQRCSNKSTTLRTGTESPMRTQSTSIHSLDRKPLILVANAARQHSHQAALALLEAGFLGCYATGVPVSHSELGAPWRALVRRFSSSYEELPLLGELTRVNMVNRIYNRLFRRYLPGVIGE